jgi:membrane AbrB-like protein
MSIEQAWRWAVLAALSLLAGWLLERATVPAALMLGPMVVAIAFGVGGSRLRPPQWAFTASQGVIGCLVARSVTPDILVSIVQDWPEILLVVTTTVVAGGLVGWTLYRYGAMPGTTAAWGSSPGAASAMIVMAQEYGADVRLVAFMQYLRSTIVVLTASLVSKLLIGFGAAPATPLSAPASELVSAMPALSLVETLVLALGGAWLGRVLRIPAGGFLFPMVAGAALHATGTMAIELPHWLLGIAYCAVGWTIGLAFTWEALTYAFRAIPQMLLATAMLIALCGLSAWMLTWLLHLDALTAYLSTSPGGLDSVAIIAVGSNADIATVLAIQTLRLFVVILVGPQVAKLISRYG